MKKINSDNLFNIVCYYRKKGNITKENIRALVLRFLMENKKLNEFIVCYRHCHGDDYNLEDIFDDSVYYLFKNGYKIGDYFSMKPISFDWGACENNGLCKFSTWGHISSEWRALTRDLMYGGEK